MNINTTVEYTEQDMRRYYLASYLYKRWWALLMVAIMEIIIVTSSVIKREIGLLTIVYSVLVVFYLVFTPLRVIFYARKQYSTGKIWQKPIQVEWHLLLDSSKLFPTLSPNLKTPLRWKLVSSRITFSPLRSATSAFFEVAAILNVSSSITLI